MAWKELVKQAKKDMKAKAKAKKTKKAKKKVAPIETDDTAGSDALTL